MKTNSIAPIASIPLLLAVGLKLNLINFITEPLGAGRIVQAIETIGRDQEQVPATSETSAWLEQPPIKDLGSIRALFKVSSRVEFVFRKMDLFEKRRGRICSCGHPLEFHGQSCGLSEVCHCVVPRSVLHADDIRPFFQATHGPLESHALGRGLALAKTLEIATEGRLECSNCHTVNDYIGACRQRFKGLGHIQAKLADTERHVIYCQACVDVKVFGSQLGEGYWIG